jgi:hypothetical protein
MSEKYVAVGFIGGVAGVLAKAAYDYITAPKEPAWAKAFMKHITIGGLCKEGEKGVLQFINTGSWEPKLTESCYYLFWRVGEGVKDLQAHIELRPPTPTDQTYVLEIYHSWVVPKEKLVVTDLPHEVVVEEPHLLVLRFKASKG